MKLYSFTDKQKCWIPSKRQIVKVKSYFNVLIPPAGSSGVGFLDYFIRGRLFWSALSGKI